jgi:hypothetical protein
MEKVKKLRLAGRILLAAFIIVLWSIPLFMPIGSMERYALEEIRVAVVFFILGIFFTIGYYNEKRGRNET